MRNRRLGRLGSLTFYEIRDTNISQIEIFVREAVRVRGGNVFVHDPVCGMDVEAERAAVTSMYDGQTY